MSATDQTDITLHQFFISINLFPTMNTLHKNLRRDPVSGNFIPAKSPRRFSDCSLTPLLPLPHGNLLLCFSGSTLYLLDKTDDTVVLTHTAPSPILTAVLCTESLCTVFLNSGQLSLIYSDGSWKIDQLDFFPELTLQREAAGSATMTVAERKLTKSYALTDHTLNATDAASLTDDLLEAYSSLRQSTDAAGVFLQPVFARCRYLDAAGKLVFVTPPVMIASGNGFQCTSSLSGLYNGDTNSRGVMTLSADTFRIKATIPDVVCQRVERLIIEVTPQLDIVNFNGSATNAVMHSSNGGLQIRASLPIAPSTLDGKHSLVDAALDHLDKLFRTVSVVVNPFCGEQREITVSADSAATTDVRSSVASLRKALSTPPAAMSSNGIVGGGAVPHSVTCSTVAKNGDTLMMGDLKLIPFAGYSLVSFAPQLTDEKWKAAVAVEFGADGTEKLVRYCEGSAGSPSLLGPLVSYPRADACRMTIFFQSGGKCYRTQLPLTPSRTGNFAYYLSPGLLPVNLKETDVDFFIVPAQIPVSHTYPGTVAVAPATTPSSLGSFRRISAAPVTAVTHALGSSAGWDYVRSRFYVFTPEGTFSVITDSASISGVNKVDARSVSNRENVVPFTRRGAAALTDGGELLFWRGVSPQQAGENLSGRLAYDSFHDELWIFGSQRHIAGPASAPLPFNHSVAMERTFPDTPSVLCHTPEGTLVKGVSGLYLLGKEADEEQLVDVRFFRSFPVVAPVKGCTVSQRRKGSRLSGVKLLMQSPGPLNIAVTVKGDHGAGLSHSPIFYSFKVRGMVNSPLLFHTPSPHLHRVHLTAQGQLPSDSSFTDFEILTEPYENK